MQSGGEDSPLALSGYKFRAGGHDVGDHILRRGESAIHCVGKDDWKNGGQNDNGHLTLNDVGAIVASLLLQVFFCSVRPTGRQVSLYDKSKGSEVKLNHLGHAPAVGGFSRVSQ